MSKKTKNEHKEPDVIDQILSRIDFHGLTQEQVLGKGGILKQLTGKEQADFPKRQRYL